MQNGNTMLDPNEVLMQAFHHHGHHEARIEGEWIIIPNYPPARATIHPFSTRQELVNLQLDVEIALDDGRVLAESCAGLGKDQDEALTNAISKFSANAFHALLVAFYDYPIDEQIDVHEWSVDGTQ